MTGTKLLGVTPAPYSRQLIDYFVTEIRDSGVQPGGILFDCFAGVGHVLAEVAEVTGMVPLGYEIERGYHAVEAQYRAHPCVQQANSRKMSLPNCSIDIAMTSPAYPNGVSDSFHAQDDTVRHTYVHRLRAHLGADYELHPDNAGGKSPRRSPKALREFYAVHIDVWREMYRVLKPGAIFIVNTKDTTAVPFRQDTENQLVAAGFEVVRTYQVKTPGLNHGKNRENKVDAEDLTVVRKRA